MVDNESEVLVSEEIESIYSEEIPIFDEESLDDECLCNDCVEKRQHENMISEIEPIDVFNTNESLEQNQIDVCSICLCELNVSSNDTFLLECNHRFHTECIISVFRRSFSYENNGKCPLCRNIPETTIFERNHKIEKYELLEEYLKINKDKCHPYIQKLMDGIQKCENKIKKYSLLKKKSESEKKKIEKENRKIIKERCKISDDIQTLKNQKRRVNKIIYTYIDLELEKLNKKLIEIEMNNKGMFENLQSFEKQVNDVYKKIKKETSTMNSFKSKLNDIPIKPIYVRVKVNKK